MTSSRTHISSQTPGTPDPKKSAFVDLSVVIITLNEGLNIGRCLDHLPAGCEVIVVDSMSTDDTRKIAEARGAQVVERPFDDFSEQKNYGLALAKRSWILSLDADEVLSRECQGALEKVCGEKSNYVYRINRHLVFMGRVMGYGRTVDHPVRLFPRGKAKFVGVIHEKLEFNRDTKVRNLPADAVVLHYSYVNLYDYFVRFNRYTDQVARNHFDKGDKNPSLLRHVLRPWFDFVMRYVFKGGFLDGYPGYVYALISSFYAFIKYAKLIELSKRPANKGGPSKHVNSSEAGETR